MKSAHACLLAALVLAPAVANGQAPFTVAIAPTLDPLPMGLCGAVHLRLVDATGERPRNPAGVLMSIADFDMTVTSADPRAVAGHHIDAYHWYACGCQAGAVGAVATITASYPAARLTAKERLPGVVVQATARFMLSAAKGTSDPPSCSSPAPATIAAGGTPIQTVPATKTAATAPTRVLAGGAGGAPLAPAPTGTRVPTTLPAGAPPTGVTVSGTPLIARVTWNAVPGAARYAVFRKDDAQLSVEKSPAGFTPTQFTDTVPDPRITYLYTVVAHYADGSSGEAPAVSFTSPPLVNPSGFAAVFTPAPGGGGAVALTWQPVPGAMLYRLDGPGLPDNGLHQVAPSTIVDPVPPGPGTWKVTTLYPGNYADYATASTAQAMVRVLPSHGMPWLSRKGVGSQTIANDHVNYECGYVMACDNTGSQSIKTNAFGLELWGDPRRARTEAVYGNPGDLGVGRRTDCAQGMVAPPYARFVTICYSTSHGPGPGVTGFGDPATITTAASGGVVPVNYDTTKTFVDPWGLMPRGATMITMDQGGVTFLAFTAGINQPVTSSWSGDYWTWGAKPSAVLAPIMDTEGPKFAPQSCIACHGGQYNAATKRVDGATLLPLDPELLVFAGGDRASQEENIRKINLIVRNSSPSAAVRNYINGLYNGAVAQPGAKSVASYVPTGWAPQTGFYRQVVKPYCAMCHLAAPVNLSFASWANFQQNAPAIHTAVCTTRTMPHAEIPFTQLWLKDTGALFLPGLLAASLGFPSC